MNPIPVDFDIILPYDYKALYRLFMSREGHEFEFTLAKGSKLPESPQYDVFLEYITAAQTGQLLAEVSDVFSYYVPSVYEQTAFVFNCTVPDKEALIDQVDYILCAFSPERDEARCHRFHQQAAELLNKAPEGKMECHCWGLLELAGRYL